MARLEGVLFIARETQLCGVKSVEDDPAAVTVRTIQRVPKVHGS